MLNNIETVVRGNVVLQLSSENNAVKMFRKSALNTVP